MKARVVFHIPWALENMIRVYQLTWFPQTFIGTAEVEATDLVVSVFLYPVLDDRILSVDPMLKWYNTIDNKN